VNPRTTGILFLIAAALGAFVWFYEIRGEAGRKDAELAAKRLFPGVEASAVDAIELTTSDGQRARLERADADWRIASPLSAPADGFAVDAIAAALTQLVSESVYDSPQPLDVYALEDAGRDVKFRAGGADHGLRLGRKTPVGGNHYALVVGQSRVYVVSNIAVNALARSLDELREKRVLRFDPAAVERIELRWPDGFVKLARGEEGWRLEQPIEGRADDTTVDDLLNDLAFLRASSFVDAPSPAQVKALEPGELVVELALKPPESGEAPAPLRLVIGARDGGDGDRLVRGAGPGLFHVPSERLQDFPRDVASYRFRTVSRFALEDARELELRFETAGGEPVVLSATRSDDAWSSTPEAIDGARLATLVDELSRLRALRILADEMGEAELHQIGLSPPNARFTVTGKGGQLAQVDVGLVRPEGVVARAAGAPTVYLLAPTVADYLPESAEALRTRFITKPGDVKDADAQAGADASEPAPGLEAPSEPEP